MSTNGTGHAHASPTRSRWDGIERAGTGSSEDVEDVLRGTVEIEHTLARRGAERLWELIHRPQGVRSLGALTGNQAVQMVKAGLEGDLPLRLAGRRRREPRGRHLSRPEPLPGEQRAGARAAAEQRAPARRPDREGGGRGLGRDWFVPIVADAEAGFGGPLNAFELMKAMIEAGAAGVHFEDQLASEKKCGHLGGKVLVPTAQFVGTLKAARLAADVLGVPTVLISRTDADAATLLTSDIDPADHEFLTGERTPEGFFRVRDGLEPVIARSLAYAPYADMLWFETSKPDMGEAREFAQAIHEEFPGKLLAYNCSPSFNWRKHLGDEEIAGFQSTLGELGYRFQFITLAGFHALNASMFELARGYVDEGMPAYVRLQEREFELEAEGYTATRHQREVGAGYFDAVAQTISGGESSTLALRGSTEEAQFEGAKAPA